MTDAYGNADQNAARLPQVPPPPAVYQPPQPVYEQPPQPAYAPPQSEYAQPPQPGYLPPQPAQPAAFPQPADYGAPQPYTGSAAGVPGKRAWSVMALIGFGVAVIVLGISLFSGIVIIAALPILWSIRAIIEVRRTGKRGLGFAIAGLVMGVLSAILYVLNLV